MLSPDQAAEILGLHRPFTADAVKRAYRRKSKETHPDRGGSDDAFKQVALAKEVLDREILRSGRAPQPRHQHQRSGHHHRNYRNYDPFNPFWDDDDEEDEDETAFVGAWYKVIGVTAGGVRLDQKTTCRAQLVQIRDELLIAVYLLHPQRIETEEVTVVLAEEDDPELTPNLFTRIILQRSYSVDGLTSAFWFSPFRDDGANKTRD